ncbi:MAG: hypothetical protein HOF44_08455 [Pelagibacterales bacterium]|nr:hypothetical protein [Pelagibacterales bacterium]
MHILKVTRKLEDIIFILIGILFPWSIMFATPQLNFGYWGQVEGMVVFNHFMSAIIALLLLKAGLDNKEIRQYFSHPVVLLPAVIGLYSIIASAFHMLPVFSLYGSPQLGQGAFGYFALSLLTVLYFHVFKTNKIKLLFFINLLLIVLVITIGSFFPVITGIVISFFGFNDWLGLYFTAFIIYLIHLLEITNLKINKKVLGFIFFLLLGPLFWIIDNNSSIALWVILSLVWLFWLISFYYNIKIKFLHQSIFNPLFFTLITIFLSVIMLVSSYIFWDGKTDMTNQITDSKYWGHLATMVARGSIVRVLFEHLDGIQALVFGFGWGNTSELLLKSFTPEVFYQINTGNRVHFHTHNELFEHIFSIGLVGALFYIIYLYNIFKCSFRISMSISFLWLLYFCIGVFWFQWISNISIQAMLIALLLTNSHINTQYVFSEKIRVLFNSIYFYTFYMIFISMFLFYGAYIGYYTAYKDTISSSPERLIEISEESKVTGNCSQTINDYGKGGLQFSQRYNGFNNYFKDQIMLYGVINKSDSIVLNWYICAADEMILANKASLELMNVHVSVFSTISVLPGKLGDQIRNHTKKYMNLWEERLMQLMSLAPKRVDQATPLISYYLKNNNDDGVKRICSFFDDARTYQGFCDLALGAIYIKEKNFDQGIYLIKRANQNGILDSKDVDKDTAKYLKSIIAKYD